MDYKKKELLINAKVLTDMLASEIITLNKRFEMQKNIKKTKNSKEQERLLANIAILEKQLNILKDNINSCFKENIKEEDTKKKTLK